MIVSMFGIILCLGLLGGLFFAAAAHSPPVSAAETELFWNSTCPQYNPAVSWKCVTCLKASSDCGFCANGDNKLTPGACLIDDDHSKGTCLSGRREWYTQGCPSNFWWIALVALAAYIISYSPGMGNVP